MLATDKKVWLITDTHWHHKAIIGYENRPENFEELIYANWREFVSEDDIVVHLGDVIFARASELTEILNSLPGEKWLTGGNHDFRKIKWYIEHGFDKVYHHIYVNGTLLSHEPVDMSDYYDTLNIHGHFHTDEIGEASKGYPFYDINKNIRLSLEEQEYKPVLMDSYIDGYKNR